MFRSIRIKLTLWYICVLALVFAAFAVATYSLFVRVLEDEMRKNISEMADNFVTAVNQDQNEKQRPPTAEAIIEQALFEFNFRDYRFAVVDGNGRLVGKTLDEDLPAALSESVENRFFRASVNNEPFSVLERSFKLDGREFRLFTFFSRSDQIATEWRVRNIFLVGVPVLLLLAGIGGYFLARQGLRPIAVMGERAKQIGAENLHERLPVKNAEDEIGNLAVLFNQLLDRLDREFERQRRFMADASHELRTPLAIIRGESEVALQKDHRGVGEYQDSLRIVNDEGKRLTKIVEDLFTLARADSGDVRAQFAELSVDEIVEDCVTSLRTLADRNGVRISLHCDELKVRGDENLLRRLFLNLLDNAVKHNNKAGRVEVTVSGGRVDVMNTGPEIPDDQRELIFERFYRIDKAHSRQADTLTSGAGLGLAIAKWIAEIHHSQLSLSRTETGENIFSVEFAR